jgi:hypothetical protein
VGHGYWHNEDDSFAPTGRQALKTRRVQGIGGITGKALALSIIGGAAYGVIKLLDLVTDDAGARSPDLPARNAPH